MTIVLSLMLLMPAGTAWATFAEDMDEKMKKGELDELDRKAMKHFDGSWWKVWRFGIGNCFEYHDTVRLFVDGVELVHPDGDSIMERQDITQGYREKWIEQNDAVYSIYEKAFFLSIRKSLEDPAYEYDLENLIFRLNTSCIMQLGFYLLERGITPPAPDIFYRITGD